MYLPGETITHMWVNVHKTIIANSLKKKWKQPKCLINSRKDKPIVEYSHIRVPYHSKNEKNTATSMEKAWKYIILEEGSRSIQTTSICIKFKTKQHVITDCLRNIYMDGSSEEEKGG